MKVKFQSSIAGMNFSHAAGDIVDVPNALAQKYIASGTAIAVKKDEAALHDVEQMSRKLAAQERLANEALTKANIRADNLEKACFELKAEKVKLTAALGEERRAHARAAERLQEVEALLGRMIGMAQESGLEVDKDLLAEVEGEPGGTDDGGAGEQSADAGGKSDGGSKGGKGKPKAKSTPKTKPAAS